MKTLSLIMTLAACIFCSNLQAQDEVGSTFSPQMNFESECCFEICITLVDKATQTMDPSQRECYNYPGGMVPTSHLFNIPLNGKPLSDYDIIIDVTSCDGTESINYIGDASTPAQIMERFCGTIYHRLNIQYNPFGISTATTTYVVGG